MKATVTVKKGNVYTSWFLMFMLRIVFPSCSTPHIKPINCPQALCLELLWVQVNPESLLPPTTQQYFLLMTDCIRPLFWLLSNNTMYIQNKSFLLIIMFKNKTIKKRMKIVTLRTWLGQNVQCQRLQLRQTLCFLTPADWGMRSAAATIGSI